MYCQAFCMSDLSIYTMVYIYMYTCHILPTEANVVCFEYKFILYEWFGYIYHGMYLIY